MLKKIDILNRVLYTNTLAPQLGVGAKDFLLDVGHL